MKAKSKGGFEEDCFTSWRKLLCYTQRPGVVAAAKRKFNKRQRQEAKHVLQEELEDIVNGTGMRRLVFSDDELLLLRHALKIAIDSGSLYGGSKDQDYENIREVIEAVRKKLESATNFLV